MKITPATPQDLPAILQFIRDLAVYEKLEHEVTATEAILRRNLFEKPTAECVFAEIDGHKVGIAIFFHSFSTFLGKPGIYLEDLFVKPEARGKGAGKALLKYLAKLAIERDCGRLEWAVLDWNKPSIDFYLKLGAKPMDEWTTYRMTGESLRRLAE